MQTVAVLTDFLRHRKLYMERSLTQVPERQNILVLFYTALICFAAYGAIIGASHSLEQSAASAIKLPCIFLLTSAICFPALYFFLVVLGVPQNLGQLVSFVVICLAMMGMVLIVFAPVSLFFLISTNNYFFYKLLNIGIFMVAGFVGLYFFYHNLQGAISSIQDEVAQKRARLFVRLWLLLFAFVGCQLSYSLSPFFGYPDQPFIFFTKIQSNFYMDVLSTLGGRALPVSQ